MLDAFFAPHWYNSQLIFAIVINCFPSRVYGQMEYILSCVKVTTIVVISKEYIDSFNRVNLIGSPRYAVVLSLLIDFGASWQG